MGHMSDIKGLYLSRLYLQGAQQKDEQVGKDTPTQSHAHIQEPERSPPCYSSTGRLPPITDFLITGCDSPEHLRETIRPEGQLALQNRGIPKTLGSAT